MLQYRLQQNEAKRSVDYSLSLFLFKFNNAQTQCYDVHLDNGDDVTVDNLAEVMMFF